VTAAAILYGELIAWLQPTRAHHSLSPVATHFAVTGIATVEASATQGAAAAGSPGAVDALRPLTQRCAVRGPLDTVPVVHVAHAVRVPIADLR
jgi:hypothetical protein